MSDEYRAMWEKLNINMRRHDALMGALPAVFDRIYRSQRGRPQAMGFYD